MPESHHHMNGHGEFVIKWRVTGKMLHYLSFLCVDVTGQEQINFPE
tara:strand:- start:322 stop:459 length:138 start_codon:yes stop_codon:yes gene_type:complete